MDRILSLILILLIFQVSAQEEDNGSCSLKMDNKLWKIQFANSMNDYQKLVLIKHKIKADSAFVEIQPSLQTAHGPVLDYKDSEENSCGCKIQFTLKLIGDREYELNLNKYPEQVSVLDKMSVENIETIYSDLRESTSAGLSSGCGMIRLATRDSSLAKLVSYVR